MCSETGKMLLKDIINDFNINRSINESLLKNIALVGFSTFARMCNLVMLVNYLNIRLFEEFLIREELL